jgi:membrane dipeptidase
MMGVVHTANNELADSATDLKGPEWQGLSPLGREMVAECNRLGIVVDASHASDAALAQILEHSTAPIVLSHSGCKAVTDHPRNVPDDLLRTLAAKGGVIQMNAFSAYVTSLPIIPERNRALQALFASAGGWRQIDSDAKRLAFLEARREIDRRYPAPVATFDEFMAHVLHALRVAGVDHVGFSGDFDGGGGVADLMDVTGVPRITARLLAEGYTEADLAKFWGGNVLRVLRAAEERAAVR